MIHFSDSLKFRHFDLNSGLHAVSFLVRCIDLTLDGLQSDFLNFFNYNFCSTIFKNSKFNKKLISIDYLESV